MKTRRRPSWLLLIILLAGTGLRLFRLGAGSLWYDETVSTYLAGSPLPELLRHTAGDIHPPGYYMLLRGWLLLTGYPTGHADPHGQGLEFVSAYFSLFCGVLLIALVYAATRSTTRNSGRNTAGLFAAALVALSPYNVWYSQEVRMYTLAAVLGLVTILALWRAIRPGVAERARRRGWLAYTLAAAAGMYVLYYFAFLLVAINVWALLALAASHRPAASRRVQVDAAASPRHRAWAGWIVANLAALALYAPWLGVAWRQVTEPPVPPWRTPPLLLASLRESWMALSAGQSAPSYLWPALLLLAPLYLLGLLALARAPGSGEEPGGTPGNTAWRPRSARHLGVAPHGAATLLFLATFGSLALILVASPVTPLYNVRYVYTYSPGFYIVLGAGLAWLAQRARAPAAIGALALGCSAWLLAAGATLYAFWYDPAFRPDDHRAAVAYLEQQWRPGDAVLVNAGYAYTALATYWQGPLQSRSRLTAALPAAAAPDGLVMLTTGHVNGAPGLGWNDPQSDFFPMPAAATTAQIASALGHFSRLWHYRIYDTVNDPQGVVRAALEQEGRLFDDRVFAGEAYMRVQGFIPRASAGPSSLPAAGDSDLEMRATPLPPMTGSGQTLYPVLWWQVRRPLTATLATSLRLVGADGETWAQPSDEQPLGPLFESPAWPLDTWQRQSLALPVPEGTPPGHYDVRLLAYFPDSGQPWQPAPQAGGLEVQPGGSISLGRIMVNRPADPPALRPAAAHFGPLALIEGKTPATSLAPGDNLPVELLWQAVQAPGEPFVVVLQLLDANGTVAAGLEEQPLDGRYPTQTWATGELVRDRHVLALPKDLAPGSYQLVAGLYRASDRARLTTRKGLLGATDHFTIKSISVRPSEGSR